jgi:uroporphyrinogen-III synthase
MLTGDKTLPTLPDALGRAGRSLTKVKVYATRPRAKLGEDIDALDNRTDAWAVLFSPSSAAAVVLLLNRRWRIRCHDDRESGEARRTIRLLAIGETTASYLRERFVCDAVAATPDPEGVLGALRGAEGGTDRSTDR